MDFGIFSGEGDSLVLGDLEDDGLMMMKPFFFQMKHFDDG